MIQHFTAALFCLFLTSQMLWSSGSTQLQVPNQFHIKHKEHNWVSVFEMGSKQYRLGMVKRKLISLTPEYNFYDNNDRLQATAKIRFFSFGAIFDVTDADDEPLGIVEEKTSWGCPKFILCSASGEIVAHATRNFWRTRYILLSPLTNEPIAELSCSFIGSSDWMVTLYVPEAFKDQRIDPRLFLITMALQTDLKTWEFARDAYNKQENAEKRSVGITATTATIGKTSTKKSVQDHFSDKLKTTSKSLRNKLQNYREKLVGIEPQEEDFKKVEALTEHHLESVNLDDIIDDRATEMTLQCEALLPLLEDESDLEEEEQAALYLMLDKYLRD
ncbi:MAG: hypothetical protein H0X51_02775 [Parachlamydiaceae bacterium]|nr:hypothetical protein [Parachlamydiaceae bacterium]